MNELQSSMQMTLLIYLLVVFMSWMTLKAIKGYIKRDEIFPLAAMIAWWTTPLIRMLLK